MSVGRPLRIHAHRGRHPVGFRTTGAIECLRLAVPLPRPGDRLPGRQLPSCACRRTQKQTEPRIPVLPDTAAKARPGCRRIVQAAAACDGVLRIDVRAGRVLTARADLDGERGRFDRRVGRERVRRARLPDRPCASAEPRDATPGDDGGPGRSRDGSAPRLGLAPPGLTGRGE
jgi:hypothetical protein